MNVPSHQMHNVLSFYSKQLSQTSISEKQKVTTKEPSAVNDRITVRGKRRATFEKVSKEIYDKITQFRLSKDANQQNTDEITDKTDQRKSETELGGQRETKFVFNVIDGINNKKMNTLSVEDASFLIDRLEQLAKKAVEKKLESWI